LACALREIEFICALRNGKNQGIQGISRICCKNKKLFGYYSSLINSLKVCGWTLKIKFGNKIIKLEF
jgi:hypothetical protein